MKKRMISKVLAIMLGVGILFSNGIEVLAATTSTSAAQQTVENSSFTFTNGYGAIAKCANVTKGATAYMNVSTNVTALTTENDLKDFIKNNESLFTKEQYSKIIQLPAYTKKGQGAELLDKLISIVFTNSFYTNGAATGIKNVTVKDEQQAKLLKELSNLKASNYILQGTVGAVGDSYIPTTAYCYVQAAKLTFEDGKVLKVINTNPYIADGRGLTTHVCGSSDNGSLQLIQK